MFILKKEIKENPAAQAAVYTAIREYTIEVWLQKLPIESGEDFTEVITSKKIVDFKLSSPELLETFITQWFNLVRKHYGDLSAKMLFDQCEPFLFEDVSFGEGCKDNFATNMAWYADRLRDGEDFIGYKEKGRESRDYYYAARNDYPKGNRTAMDRHRDQFELKGGAALPNIGGRLSQLLHENLSKVVGFTSIPSPKSVNWQREFSNRKHIISRLGDCYLARSNGDVIKRHSSRQTTVEKLNSAIRAANDIKAIETALIEAARDIRTLDEDGQRKYGCMFFSIPLGDYRDSRLYEMIRKELQYLNPRIDLDKVSTPVTELKLGIGCASMKG